MRILHGHITNSQYDQLPVGIVIGIKIRPKYIVYSISMKIRAKSIVYSI